LRNKWYRYFWTELGRRITGTETSIPLYLPGEMTDVLRSFKGLPKPVESILELGSGMSPRKARNIYGYTWDILRGSGFSRSLRLMPWPGVSLLIPFYKDNIGVMPQSFSERIPPEKRALSLVGRSAAALKTGITMWVIPADWDDDILTIFNQGGVRACSLDNLNDLCEKGFR